MERPMVFLVAVLISYAVAVAPIAYFSGNEPTQKIFIMLSGWIIIAVSISTNYIITGLGSVKKISVA
ncbi:MAG: hypothetical protein WC788_04315 [Candidatus Paceibacterota bacterium]|jgi:hypothetical protein